MDQPLDVKVHHGLPAWIGQQPISFVLDHYRVCPNWWEGYFPRDYYLVEVGEKTLCIYQAGESWFLDSVAD